MNLQLSAWTAGFFDGEGCVYIRKMKAKGYKDGERYDLVCSISQRKPEELQRLKKLYGGNVSYYKNNGTCRAWWKWSIVSNDAVPFLEDIKPFARIKQKEIDLALIFQAKKGKAGKNLTTEQKTYQQKTYLALQQLKK